MKRLIIALAAVVALSAFGAASPGSTSAGGVPTDWPPLLNCPDVTGDGPVSIGDILQVANHFGTYTDQDTDGFFVPNGNYMLLYDVDGGGQVGVSDVLSIVRDFGTGCPLVETQVAQATLATMQYRDWNAASAAGYAPQTQYVADMGIHVSNSNYETTFDHENPIGLIYKAGPGGTPQEVIGLWYVVPTPDVCAVFLAGETCSAEEPEGFDGPEDNMDMSGVQRGWHTHQNLCFIPAGPTVVELGPSGSEQQCTNLGGILNFSTYGWMVHLYNFIPNPNGRFMMWNYQNLP